MSTIDDIIDAVIKAEVGNKPNGGYTNDPTDSGGRTQYGIAESSNPQAWADNKVTEGEARAIYRKKYVDGPGFGNVSDSHLQHLLVDYGVNSGPVVAIQALQRSVGAKVDGNLGPKTLVLVNGFDPRKLANLLVAERIRMIGRIVQRNPSQVRFLGGWLDRAISFMV